MAGLLALCMVAPAQAADIKTAVCSDNKPGCRLIYVNGDLLFGDAKKFTNLVKEQNITNAIVYLASDGGVFDEGMAMAKLVRERRYITYVSYDTQCFSMCAIIWLAGEKRWYTGTSTIGFHGITVFPTDKEGHIKDGSKGTPSYSGNALLGAFYSRLGLQDAAIAELTEHDADHAYYLNTKNLAELGITAERWVPPQPKQQQGNTFNAETNKPQWEKDRETAR